MNGLLVWSGFTPLLTREQISDYSTPVKDSHFMQLSSVRTNDLRWLENSAVLAWTRAPKEQTITSFPVPMIVMKGTLRENVPFSACVEIRKYDWDSSSGQRPWEWVTVQWKAIQVRRAWLKHGRNSYCWTVGYISHTAHLLTGAIFCKADVSPVFSITVASI